ncbi:hypothetical protein GP475_02755 [Corynebacterium poyangense]|uniref:Uncharacterized protein n=1 Tax=Corynebacterium poyangense TaxID=2684405 RepID=A0A7H0SMA7_9CORY|nr:DUF5319 family protein [Corynebacterium poyangense]QNQ89682.1 hypothetical protein GP475_02755 [Corynebacterium poyangense]
MIEDDDAGEFLPMDVEETRKQVEMSLDYAYQCLKILAPMGIRGVSAWCESCEIEHYYDWDIVIRNLKDNLAGQPASPHEPAVDVDPSDYRTWDYCCGFIDGCSQR